MNWVHPISLILATWVAAFLQAMPWAARWGVGAPWDVLPAFVVYAAFSASLPTTTGVAVVAGLSHDALSSGPFGLSVVPLLTLGVALHRRRDLVLRESVWTQGALGAVATLASTVLALVLLWVFGPLVATGPVAPGYLGDYRAGGDAGPDWGLPLLWQALVVTVGGALVTPVVFRFFGWIDATFNYRPVAAATTRGDREIKRGRF